jgi:N-acetylglucosaminyl-diphospho-decaprenol L-rhamnosyltransferase
LPSPSPPITVAIVSWNTRALLARCLESLTPDVDSGIADVWVVDNASSDGSADLVREQFAWANLVASEENLGFGSAANLAASKTDSEWIAIANADIAVHPGALATLLEAGARDPRAGALGPRLRMPNGRTQHSVGAFPTITFSLLHASGAFRFQSPIADRFAFPERWDSERRRRVPWAMGAFLLVRREAWDQVGGFDERQWMYAEDLDLGWRLSQAGWATRYEPLAMVEHEVAAATSQQFGDERAPIWQRATYGCIARRRSPTYARAVAFVNLLGALGRWPKNILRSRGHPDGAEWRAGYRRWLRVHLNALDPREDVARLT